MTDPTALTDGFKDVLRNVYETPVARKPVRIERAQKNDIAWLETGLTGSQLTEKQREMRRQFYERRNRNGS